jgi:hypothetical protein
MKKHNTSPLDFAMAALAGASVAFAVFAMPEWRFEQAVGLSGLPLIVPAAQPPLGDTARLLVAAIAGAFAFGLAWLVLRSIGNKPAAPKKRFEPVEIDVVPTIRRADAHPDAPARRPIFAGLDLGEPIEPEAEREPFFAPVAEEAAEEEQPVAEEDYPCFTPVNEPEEAEELELSKEAVEPQYEQDSIPHLMQRLELGLLRRERKAENVGNAAPVWSSHAPAEQERIDERLRGAIADLQKLAARS